MADKRQERNRNANTYLCYNLDMNYSDLIKRLRETLLLSQTEFAKIIGVSFATINRWENGHNTPTYKYKRKIIELCKKHKIAIKQLKGDE